MGNRVAFQLAQEFGSLEALAEASEEQVSAVQGLGEVIAACIRLLDDPEFQAGDYTIKWLEEWLARQDD